MPQNPHHIHSDLVRGTLEPDATLAQGNTADKRFGAMPTLVVGMLGENKKPASLGDFLGRLGGLSGRGRLGGFGLGGLRSGRFGSRRRRFG
jgi:hypothetical protein